MSAGLNIRLPKPPDRYDPKDEAANRREIELAFQRLPQTESGLHARRDVQWTTGALANNAEEQGSIGMGAFTQALLVLQSNRACRLRLYASAAARGADYNRSRSTDPKAGIGMLGEFIWLDAHTKLVSPAVTLYNADGPVSDLIYYTVQNLSGSTGTITLTFTVLTIEGGGTAASGGSGSGSATPKATSTVSGTVKTDIDQGDPLVYTKTTTDTLLALKSDVGHTHTTLPSGSEKDALAGTNGTPSSTNKYVTDSDPRLGGGGGGSSTEGRNPDTFPVSADSMNDEFETGSTIDLTKWSARLVTTLTSSVHDGALELVLPQTASVVSQGYTQPVPGAGDCGFAAKLVFAGQDVNFHQLSVLVETGAGASRRTLLAALGWSGGAVLAVHRLSTDSDTFSTTIGSVSGLSTHLIRLPIYLRIDLVGTNVVFSYSFNGRRYRTIVTEAQASWLGGRPARVGIALTNQNGSNGDAVGFVEWFRRVG